MLGSEQLMGPMLGSQEPDSPLRLGSEWRLGDPILGSEEPSEALMMKHKCSNVKMAFSPQKTLYPAFPARSQRPFIGSKWRDQFVKSRVSPRRNAQNPIKTNIFS